jgi:hypothetical protein
VDAEMNGLFLTNMQLMLDNYKAPNTPAAERSVRLHKGGLARSIIEYLLENGECTGTELMQALNLPQSPQCYIQPHLIAARVLCRRVTYHQSIYSIHPDLTYADFGLEGKAA